MPTDKVTFTEQRLFSHNFEVCETERRMPVWFDSCENLQGVDHHFVFSQPESSLGSPFKGIIPIHECSAFMT